MKKREAHNKTNKKELLEDILNVYNNKGSKKFTRDYYLKNGKFSRSPITTYGGWNNLLKELNIDINVHYDITKEDIIEDFFRVKNSLGKISSTLFRKHGKYSQKKLDELFGSYTNFLKIIGQSSKYAIREMSDTEIIEEMKQLYEREGYINSTLISTKTPFCHQTIINRFGSMSNLYKLMEVDNNVNSNCYFNSANYVIDLFAELLNETPIREWTSDFLLNPEKNSHLYVDAYFPKHNIALEYNGQQHYDYIEFLHKEYDKFLRTQLLDRHKEKLLKNNNITLITFKYNEPKTKEYIKEIIKITIS